jgi:hypothetical protein
MNVELKQANSTGYSTGFFYRRKRMATIHESEETIPFTRPVNGRLIKAKLKYWIWTLFGKVVFALVYVGILSEGFRVLVPAMARKVYRLPFLGFLKQYTEFYKLDLAPIFALILMLAVFWLTGRMIKTWMVLRSDYRLSQRERIDVCFGAPLFVLDALFFYFGASHLKWGSAGLDIWVLLATVTYSLVLLYVSYVSVTLHLAIEELED